MNKFQEPNNFLTSDLLDAVLKEFEWPISYILEDDLPDGMIMRFPRCNLYFREGYEGDIELHFLKVDTGTDYPLKLAHAISVIVPEAIREGNEVTPNLINDSSIYGSQEKMRNGIRDICKILLTHLLACIQGDWSWLEIYKKAKENGS